MTEIRITEEDMVAYTYCIVWKKYNKQYYGIRYANGCRTSDMWTKYFTSSKVVKNFREEFGEPDLIIIDQFFTDIDEAREYEKWVLDQNVVHISNDWLNVRASKAIIFGEEQRSKIGEANRRRIWSDESRRKLSIASTGRKFSEQSRKKMSDWQIGSKYSVERCKNISDSLKGKPGLKGKDHPSFGKPLSEEHRRKLSISLKGKMVGEKNPMYGKPSHMRGKKLSQERKEILRQKATGRRFSDEVNAKKGKKGLDNKNADQRTHIFTHEEHGKFIGKRVEFIEQFKLHISSVGAIIRGERKSHKGWTYRGEYQPD